MTKAKEKLPFRELSPEEQLYVANPDMTPELQNKLEKLIKFFNEHGIDYTKFDFDKKRAYPNYDQYVHFPAQHDMEKWVGAVRNIYQLEHGGHSRMSSIRHVVAGWKVTETFDFLNWLRFYESGTHMKYKMAQLWYENGAPGYFLQIKPDPVQEQTSPINKDIDFAREESSINAEKREKIEKQRNKIIGRLDSAEKLLRAPDGHLFAGPEFEALMEAIYQLKKKIQMVNKISESIRLYEDMIVREANVLQRLGFVKAAEFLHSTAQANNPPPNGMGQSGPINMAPSVSPPDSPIAPLNPGAPGGLPSMGPGMPQKAPSSAAPESAPNENSPTNLIPQDNTPEGIKGFLSNMDTSKVTTQSDKAVADDELTVQDDMLEVKDEELMVTEAQAMPGGVIDEPMTTTPAPVPPNPASEPLPTTIESPATETPLEVTEDDVVPPPVSERGESPEASDFDAKVNAVFSDITVSDVVVKLEDIAKIYKTREVPRQLGVVDMMLDSLGLASYFPSLSEAINKSLESNNYISTRLDDILSRLRGAIAGKGIDLKGGDSERPEVAGVKKNLSDADAKERRRKEQRKAQEVAELEGSDKETPEVEIEEDLAPKSLVPSARQPAAGPVPVARPLG